MADWHAVSGRAQQLHTLCTSCLAMIQHDLGYGIISDSCFFRSNPELYSVPMINKDGTAFTRKTWMVYHPAELENHLAKNFEFLALSVSF